MHLHSLCQVLRNMVTSQLEESIPYPKNHKRAKQRATQDDTLLSWLLLSPVALLAFVTLFVQSLHTPEPVEHAVQIQPTSTVEEWTLVNDAELPMPSMLAQQQSDLARR